MSKLQELLQEKRDELRVLLFKVSERQLKTVHAISLMKKTIAQIRTAIAQKQLASDDTKTTKV